MHDNTDGLLFNFPFNVFETGRNHFVFEGYNALAIEVAPPMAPKMARQTRPMSALTPGQCCSLQCSVFSLDSEIFNF